MFLEWLTGHALSKISDRIFQSLQIDGIEKEILAVLNKWQEALPIEMRLESPYALFPAHLIDGAIDERPKMLQLRASLDSSKPISVDDWYSALMEQWHYIQKNENKPHPFFECDEEVISPKLQNLAEELSSVCNRYPEFFNAKALMQLSSLDNSLTSVESKIDGHIVQSELDSQNLINEMSSTHEDINQLPKIIYGQVEQLFDSKIEKYIQAVSPVNSGDTNQQSTDIREQQIDDLAELIKTDPATSLMLLEKLRGQLEDDVSGRILYRVEANIAVCNLELGNEEIAADGFISVFDLDPRNPNAVANKSFGLMLKGQAEELKSFAINMLAEMPDNETLARNLILGLRADETVDDPISLIPEISQDKPGVIWAYICWLMDRGQPGEWWAYTKDAYQQYPNSDRIAEYYANSLLDKILHQTGFEFGKELTDVDVTELKTCVKIYEQIWSDLRTSQKHIRSEYYFLPLNLTLVYRLLNQIEDSIRVGRVALEIFPDNPLVMERLAAAFLENGQKDDAKSLIQKLEPTQETVLMQFDLLLSDQDWDGIDRIVSDHIDLFPEDEKNVAQAAKIIADVERSHLKDQEKILEEFKESFKGDVRANMLLAGSARKHCLNKLSLHFFNVGFLALNSEQSTFANRLTVANEASARNDVETVIKMLDGYISLNRDSQELRLFAKAVVHEFPIRERARRFFENLNSLLLDIPFYQRLKGIYHYQQGGYKEAINSFLKVYNSELSIRNLVWLIRAYLSNETRKPISELLEDISLDQLNGHPLDQMDLCLVLLDFEYTQRAIDLGYKVLCSNDNDAEIAVKFCGLILKATLNSMNSVSNKVETGKWVLLVDSEGKEYSGLIDEDNQRPWGDAIDSSNAFIKNAIGLSVNNKFVFENAIGMSETWIIKEIKPNWLHAFHFMCENFSQRFPEENSFASFKMRDDDIQPTLDQIKRTGEALRKHADLYLVNRLPLGIVAGDRPGGAIGFANYLADIGEQVFTCLGTLEERQHAFEVIKEHKQRGAVLDAFTAWHAANLGIFPILEKHLGTLFIPSSELDGIKSLVRSELDQMAEESMSISYLNGEFIRTMVSSEDRVRSIEARKRLISEIETACSVELVVLPDKLPDIGEALLKFPSSNVISPIVLAGNDKLLLSDDMSLRQIAKTSFDVEGVWLQSVLAFAFESKQLSLEAYSEALVTLAAYKHDIVSVSSSNLYSVFCHDKSSKLVKLQALCYYIGIRNADKNSHIKLVVDFINNIWTVNSADFRIYKATGMVLSSLLTCYRKEEFASWAAITYIHLVDPAREYFNAWCFGHFLPVSEIITEAKTLLDNSD